MIVYQSNIRKTYYISSVSVDLLISSVLNNNNNNNNNNNIGKSYSKATNRTEISRLSGKKVTAEASNRSIRLFFKLKVMYLEWRGLYSFINSNHHIRDEDKQDL